MRRNRKRTKGDSGNPGVHYYKIGEVARIASVETHVLRYWETEFPMLQPHKAPSGHRKYRREDISMVLEIKRLLYEQKYTIAGARNALIAREQASPRALGPASPGDALALVRSELRAVLDLLGS